MQVIPPVAIVDSMLISSSAPEEVAATYSAMTAYDEGDLAGLAPVYGEAQTVYESLADANTGNALTDTDFWKPVGDVYPVYNSGSSCDTGGIVTDLATHSLYQSLVDANTGNPLTDTTKWEYIGKTNRWRMFDYTRNVKTASPTDLTVVIEPGKRINSLALVGLMGVSYSISVSSTIGGGVIYTDSGTLNTRNTRTWSEYYWGEFSIKPSLVYFDIPPFTDNVVTVTITGGADGAQLGALIVGTFVSLGNTELGAQSDVLNFSTVDRDADGNAILNVQRNIPKTNQRVWCKKSDVNRIKQARTDLNGAVAIWYAILDDDDGYFEVFAILGFYRNFVIDASYPNDAVITLELEEV